MSSIDLGLNFWWLIILAKQPLSISCVRLVLALGRFLTLCHRPGGCRHVPPSLVLMAFCCGAGYGPAEATAPINRLPAGTANAIPADSLAFRRSQPSYAVALAAASQGQ